MIEHIEAVGVGKRKGDILLGEQERQQIFLAQPLNRLGQEPENDWRQAQCRLVENQELRLHHQCAPKRQHLLFAARERARRLCLALLENGEEIENPGELAMTGLRTLVTGRQRNRG